jgi:signal transduction histidine kinase
MTRATLRTWVSFGACVGLALLAVAGLSRLLMRLDREGAEARHASVVEENVRLALWRIDAALNVFLAQENAPGDWNRGATDNVAAYFELDASGNVLWRRQNRHWERSGSSLAAVGPQLIALAPDKASALALRQVAANDTQLQGYIDNSQSQQAPRSAREFQYRQSNNARLVQGYENNNDLDRGPATSVRSVLVPVWLGSELFLIRRAEDGRVQGAWLAWPKVTTWLLGLVRDLLPAATLEPVSRSQLGGAHQLASLPAQLIPGALDVRDRAGGAPAWLVLVIAWAGVVLASIAIGVLLFGTLALSERRGAFVSAVTHELRTPLTTFRVYTEMLSEGMVRSEEQRMSYLATLRREAGRLSHLVENVLSFSRVEEGRSKELRSPTSVRALIDRIAPRLEERALEATLTMTVDADEDALGSTVLADGSAVEQILFNLVDNASKYGASAGDRRLHVGVVVRGRRIAFSVRDHGPGLAPEAKRRLFVPFSKPANQAAESAPGVGLGLALCRRLARSLGGDLVCEQSTQTGTCFTLTLRRAR